MTKRTVSILTAVAAFTLLGVQSSHSFRLDDLLKPPPQKQPEKQQAAPEQQPQQQQENSGQEGGLIGLGESLGIFDKKTSKVLKQGVGTLQAFQPIGYEEEKAIGGSLAIEVFDKFGGMHTDAKLQKYVNLVGRSVADVSDRPEIEYHFAVVNTDQPNAFAAPGGYVFVSVGLLRLLQNEAQLAGVLGHEIAHITQKHALSTLQRSKVLSGLSGLTMAAMDKDAGLFDNVINEVSNVLFTRGLDKELEFEADKFGTEFAYRMGYQPAGLKEFLSVLSQSRASNGSIFLSTHPSPRERNARLMQLLPRYQGGARYPILANRYQSVVKGRI